MQTEPPTPKPQVQIPTTTNEPLTLTPSRFIPKPKRRVYVDPEEMSWYIEQISLSLSPYKAMTRSDSVWPVGFLYKV
jgi:hypothetical protein